MTERELVERFYAALKVKESMTLGLKKANEELDEIETRLLETLSEQEKTATATFEGIGYASIAKPQVRASIKVENREVAFKWLEMIKRTDLIKTSVDARTLSSFVRERLESNDPAIPECITYYLEPDVRLYDEKGKRIGATPQKGESQ